MLVLQGYIVGLRSLRFNTWRPHPPFSNMAETLGEKLRAAREERGISISEVAEQTRIAPMYIECIEKDNYKPLPGGIFNKGFVKSYARYVGFDEQEALQDYARIATQIEDTEADHLRTYRPEVLTDDRASQSTLSTIIFAGIILTLMTGGIWFLVNYISNQPAAPVATNTATTQNTAHVDAPVNVPPTSGAPTMQNLKVEFRSTTEPISLSATNDGKTSVNTVTPGDSLTFEPKESLKLSYSKSLSASAQLMINGKMITLPTTPANPKRAAIEIEINKDNLAPVWESGQFQFGVPQPAVTPAQTPATTQTPAVPGTATPRPTTPTPTVRTTPAATSTVRPTPTPIIVGRPANARPTPN
jgi:cytoskeleton protein RodZ